MRPALLVGLLLGSSLVASGCVVVDRHSRGLVGRPSCHPSQYWDGSQCRHKGKGHGARKHDSGPVASGKGKKR